MRRLLLIQGAILILTPSIASSEIFELVHDYDLMAEDIRSADLNNDGLEDFAVADIRNDSSGYEVFLSNGDCSFDSCGWVFVDTAHIDQLLIEDWNEDGNHDLMLVGYDSTWFYEGDGTGSFTNSVTYPWSLYNGCTADLNADGHLDLVGITVDSSPYDGDSVVVMLGDGNENFTFFWSLDDFPYGYNLNSAVVDFFNDDACLDLCVSIEGGGANFLMGLGDGSFTTMPDVYLAGVSGWAGPYFCECGDFNEDGWTDVAAAGAGDMSTAAVYILTNYGDGTFGWLYSYYIGSGWDTSRISTADLDLDGHLDLIYSDAEGSLQGNGDGSFGDQLSSKPFNKYALLDIDQDTDIDFADVWGRVYRNTTIMQGIEGSSATSSRIQAFPNPFSLYVVITTSSVTQVPTELRIYDLTGRLVCEISPETTECSTVYTWDGRSGTGEVLPCGVYSARLATGDTEQKLMILKL